MADFAGLSNRLPGTVQGDVIEVLGERLPLVAPHTGGIATALVRPESISIVPDPDGSGRVLTASFPRPIGRVTITSR
ncbi:hypothetical protein ACWT_5045 [Actinoplanes sp. SE50]|uniref:hypothetical protein n=1 Tax=unclassified Actinoplanes TaxID=2626549 RepID=UPI00023ECEFA|nr:MULTISPECIES: hypothetical protein [unclassified Actinoplanes]AEV86062.1 hypothetical protein ACPL_5175 [Actinoplanes sp. SE50/110]ATO84460.1 hypothetical protein ACWT_5045 [Actinoplanes sp. SE50]SLM01870.1 hypothetical protein ACSP50_5108 [Actinoplanes sp. SE50/110]